jgi:hypothetical protein
MKSIKFTQQCEDKRHGRVFVEGQTVVLGDGSALHWIKRGLAVEVAGKPVAAVVPPPVETVETVEPSPAVAIVLHERESADEKPQRGKRTPYVKRAVDPES